MFLPTNKIYLLPIFDSPGSCFTSSGAGLLAGFTSYHSKRKCPSTFQRYSPSSCRYRVAGFTSYHSKRKCPSTFQRYSPSSYRYRHLPCLITKSMPLTMLNSFFYKTSGFGCTVNFDFASLYLQCLVANF